MATKASGVSGELELPDEHTQPMARASSRQLAPFAKSDLSIRIAGSDEEIKLPAQAVGLIVELLTQLGDNKAVTIVPHSAELTTQEVADFLGVSRPFVVKEIDEKRLPAFKVGSHRRVLFADVLEYRKRQRAESEKAFAELVAQAQELGMGY